MSQAKQCDRCGKFYPILSRELELDKDYWRYDIVKDCTHYKAKKLDLCDDCKKALFLWLGLGGKS